MYVSKKDLDTMREIEALVGGNLESVGDLVDSKESIEITEYWQDFNFRVGKLRDKLNKSFFAQEERREVKRKVKALVKARFNEA